MDLTPPGPPFRKWFPGMAERTEVINGKLAEVVRRVDRPNVLHFRTNELFVDLVEDGQDVCPDGGHYTPEAHRRIGGALARVIEDWAQTQPHLRAHADSAPNRPTQASTV
jgi:hypothetical protein